jgi:hypothetical protein
MTPLVFAILAAAIGLAVVAAGVALVARDRARRQRLELDRRLRSERLVMERVDWVAGLARARPQSGEMPAAQVGRDARGPGAGRDVRGGPDAPGRRVNRPGDSGVGFDRALASPPALA